MSQILFVEEDLVPISALADLVYCERRAALHHVEFVWEDNLFTAEGTHLHERVDAQGPTEVRGDIRIARGLRLRSLRLGLTGKADVVEFHRLEKTEANKGVQLAGVDGLWQPVPVEYKRGTLRREEGYEIQLCAQALCLEEMLDVDVPLGAIYYGRTRRRLEIVFIEDLRSETKSAIAHLHELLQAGKTPPAQFSHKCLRCSLINICLPKVTSGRRNVHKYLSRAIAGTENDAL